MASRITGISGLHNTNELDQTGSSMEARVQRGLGALLISAVEAVCVFYVSFAKLGITAASVALSTSGLVAFLHQDVFRIPLQTVAMVLALVNLFLLWRAQRLRDAPSAAWRKRPLSRGQRLRAVVVVVLSALTIALTLAEVWLHRLLHHSVL